MNDIPPRACWEAADARAIFVTEALEGHEGIFLATHTPIRGFAVSGSHAAELIRSDEQAVLEALSDAARQHAFCVVHGEPGSGKSHLIRWLSVNWPAGGDVKLLLQRADGSLEGALAQLRDRLPAEFEELFDRLGRRHRATEQGRSNIFLSNLANALDPDHFDPPLEDVQWCRQHRPGDLLSHLHVRQKWRGPYRILRLLEGGDQQRNSESASFNLFDIEELAAAGVGVLGSGVLPEVERLAHRLIAEAKIIKDWREKDWTADDVVREASGDLSASVRLMQALNLRRNDAIQNVLGVSAEGLKTLFRQVREALAERGQRLVLLLEDITSWEGIDDSLIDVLVTNAGTRGEDGARDLCPLISVVGVTPVYYRRLQGNYRGRITHELHLGEKREESGLQDVATLRGDASRLSFTARYLAAVRASVAPLDKWREALRSDRSLPPPNKCETCPYRLGCHRAFGEYHGIGLYPFTAGALERLFAALNEFDNGMTWKTPRGILQAILSPNLSQPQSIEEGRFPTAFLENKALTVESRQLSARLRDRINVAVAEEQDRSRMQRLLAYWGDPERADTIAEDDGELAFAGVRRSIFDALSLPWIGGDAGEDPGRAFETVSEPPSGVAELEPETPSEDIPEPEDPNYRSQGQRTKTQAPTRTVREAPHRRAAPTKSELERLRSQLRKWTETGELGNPSEWNKRLYDLIYSLDPRWIDLDPQLFRRLLTPELVKIEGTGQARRNHFTVKLEPCVADGLEAFSALRLDKNMSDADASYHRRNLATLMRHLALLARQYADQRLMRRPDGDSPFPAASLAQILLARAWLRGTVSPEASALETMRAILSDETGAESDPEARCDPWRQFLTATNLWHERFRNELRRMVSLRQGDSGGFGLIDASKVTAPVNRLRATLRFDPVPSEGETRISEYDQARSLAQTHHDSLGRTVRIELKQVRDRAATLRGALRGRSIRSHLERVDQIVETVADNLAGAAPDRVKQWKTAYEAVKLRLVDQADRRVEDLLSQLTEDGEGLPLGSAPLLGWLAQAPCRELEAFRSVARVGDEVCNELLAHVRDCVHEGRRSASLDEIHAIGRQMQLALRDADAKEQSDAA